VTGGRLIRVPGAVVADYLTVGMRRSGDATVLRVVGELDLATAPELREAIDRVRQSSELLVLDLAAVEFIDVSGLRVLVTACREAQREGRRLVLTNVSDPVRRIVALARLTEPLPEGEVYG
jgi:anti-anti-sigma factor